MLNHIPTNDGYTEAGYVAEVPRLHSALRFKFRPMLAEARSVLTDSMMRKSVGQAHSLLVAAVKARLVEWDSADEQGAVLPINIDTVRTLRPALLERLFSIVSGRDASDVDPELETAERDEQADDALQAAIEGRSVGSVREEAAVKN